MRFVVDAPNGKSWFRLETEAEAAQESQLMRHAVEKYFRIEREKAVQSFQPASKSYIEQDIGLNAHIQRAMPLFLTLRDQDGKAHVTAMLPASGKHDAGARFIIVGPGNADPYPGEGDAIKALGDHFGLILERERCYPYQRG
jgi:peptidoglycan/xylan/chitin deacetylase (PgdA/CDA1 family)